MEFSFLSQVEKNNVTVQNSNILSMDFILVEQCHAESIFEILMKDKKSEIKDYFEGMNHEKIMFELKWNKAPVDKCIVRIFDLKKTTVKKN